MKKQGIEGDFSCDFSKLLSFWDLTLANPKFICDSDADLTFGL